MFQPGSQIPTSFWTNTMDLHIGIFLNNSTIFVHLQNCIPLYSQTTYYM